MSFVYSEDSGIEDARIQIDLSVQEWFRLNGITDEEIYELDWSSFDEELNALLDEARKNR